MNNELKIWLNQIKQYLFIALLLFPGCTHYGLAIIKRGTHLGFDDCGKFKLLHDNNDGFVSSCRRKTRDKGQKVPAKERHGERRQQQRQQRAKPGEQKHRQFKRHVQEEEERLVYLIFITGTRRGFKQVTKVGTKTSLCRGFACRSQSPVASGRWFGFQLCTF